MEGINILNQIEYTDLSGMPCVWIIVFFLIAFIGIALFIYGCMKVKISMLCVGVGIGITFFSIFGICTIEMTQGEETYEYECTIDENVNIKDVYDNYIVVERRGDIWVLREK